MKIPRPLFLIVTAVLALGAMTAPKARAQVSVDFFYSNLHPYGEWVNTSYGYCWHPTNVAADWAPYSDGYWAYTDSGWTWVSYEDYGGIVYHYGRWANIDGEGWVWVPGTQWAPAWVSWRSSPDYVGWAPLPPEAVFHVGFGFGGWVDARFNIGPGAYNFVDMGHFGEPALGGVIVNRERNVTIINNTTNITNITNNNTNVYTGGPSYATVSAASSRPIPTLHLVRQGDPASLQAANGKILSHQQGNQLVVLAPKVTAPAGGKFPAPPEGVAKNLTTAKTIHGWDVVKDPQQRAALQAKVKTEGAKYTPAKAVDPAEVKLVTDKIKANPAGPKAPTTEAVTKPSATPGGETATGKNGKNKPAETADFVNKPAAEASATPKTGKGKNKKNHTPETAAGENGGADASPTPKAKNKKNHGENGIAGTTPTPKPKKNKSAIPADESDTPKHSNLQPFVNGEETKPKPKVHPTTAPGNANGGPQGEKKNKGKGAASPVPQ